MKSVITHSRPTRRQALLLTGGAAIAVCGAGSALAAKMQQTAVAYQATPKDEKKCANCSLFVEPKTCKTVDGEISPDGWCKLWVKKPT